MSREEEPEEENSWGGGWEVPDVIDEEQLSKGENKKIQ